MKNRAKHLFKTKMKLLREFCRPLIINVKILLGIPVQFHSPARSLLENTIIPYYASQENLSKVLFVGCDWYTNHYNKYFRNCEYWTIDPEPKQARYGSKNHIIDFLENLNDHFESGYFDLIICNGVLGFGLDQEQLAERAFESCLSCLRDGGAFVIGYDDSKNFLSFSAEGLNSLNKFTEFNFPPLGMSHYSLKPQYEYIYSFYVKPKDACNYKSKATVINKSFSV